MCCINFNVKLFVLIDGVYANYCIYCLVLLVVIDELFVDRYVYRILNTYWSYTIVVPCLPCTSFYILLPCQNKNATPTKAASPSTHWTPHFSTPSRRLQVVFYAAVLRAFETAKRKTQEALQSMQKGQLVLLGKSDPWILWDPAGFIVLAVLRR